MRLIDADAIKKQAITLVTGTRTWEVVTVSDLDNAPTIETDMSEYSDKLWKQAYERGKAEARPQGHWVYTYTNGFGNKIGHCSICKYSSEYHNFCPNCGVLMVKDAENEDSN